MQPREADPLNEAAALLIPGQCAKLLSFQGVEKRRDYLAGLRIIDAPAFKYQRAQLAELQRDNPRLFFVPENLTLNRYAIGEMSFYLRRRYAGRKVDAGIAPLAIERGRNKIGFAPHPVSLRKTGAAPSGETILHGAALAQLADPVGIRKREQQPRAQRRAARPFRRGQAPGQIIAGAQNLLVGAAFTPARRRKKIEARGDIGVRRIRIAAKNIPLREKRGNIGGKRHPVRRLRLQHHCGKTRMERELQYLPPERRDAAFFKRPQYREQVARLRKRSG